MALDELKESVSEHEDRLENVALEMEEDSEALALGSQLNAVIMDDAMQRTQETINYRDQQRKRVHDINVEASRHSHRIRNEIDFVGLSMDVGVKAAAAYANLKAQYNRNELARRDAHIAKSTSEALTRLQSMRPQDADNALIELREQRREQILEAREQISAPSNMLDEWENRLNITFEEDFNQYMRAFDAKAAQERKDFLDEQGQMIYNMFERNDPRAQDQLTKMMSQGANLLMEPDDLKEKEEMNAYMQERRIIGQADYALRTGNRKLAKKMLDNKGDRKYMTRPVVQRLRGLMAPKGVKINDSLFKGGLKEGAKTPLSQDFAALARASNDRRNVGYVKNLQNTTMSHIDGLLDPTKEAFPFSAEGMVMHGIGAYRGKDGARWEAKKIPLIQSLRESAANMQDAYDNDPRGFVERNIRAAMNNPDPRVRKWGQEAKIKMDRLSPEQSIERFQQIKSGEAAYGEAKGMMSLLTSNDPRGFMELRQKVTLDKRELGHRASLYGSQIKNTVHNNPDATKEERDMSLIIEQAYKTDNVLKDKHLENATKAIQSGVGAKLSGLGIDKDTINPTTVGASHFLGTDEDVRQVFSMSKQWEAWEYLKRSGAQNPDQANSALQKWFKTEQKNIGKLATPITKRQGSWLGFGGSGVGTYDNNLYVPQEVWTELEGKNPNAKRNVRSFIGKSTNTDYVLEHWPLSDADRTALANPDARVSWDKVKSDKIGGEFQMYISVPGENPRPITNKNGKLEKYSLFQMAAQSHPYFTAEEQKKKRGGGWSQTLYNIEGAISDSAIGGLFFDQHEKEQTKEIFSHEDAIQQMEDRQKEGEAALKKRQSDKKLRRNIKKRLNR